GNGGSHCGADELAWSHVGSPPPVATTAALESNAYATLRDDAMDCQPARRLLICAESAGARRAERPVADDRSRGSSLGAPRTIQGVGSGEFEPMGAELPGSVPVIDIAGLRFGAIEERRA